MNQTLRTSRLLTIVTIVFLATASDAQTPEPELVRIPSGQAVMFGSMFVGEGAGPRPTIIMLLGHPRRQHSVGRNGGFGKTYWQVSLNHCNGPDSMWCRSTIADRGVARARMVFSHGSKTPRRRLTSSSLKPLHDTAWTPRAWPSLATAGWVERLDHHVEEPGLNTPSRLPRQAAVQPRCASLMPATPLVFISGLPWSRRLYRARTCAARAWLISRVSKSLRDLQP